MEPLTESLASITHFSVFNSEGGREGRREGGEEKEREGERREGGEEGGKEGRKEKEGREGWHTGCSKCCISGFILICLRGS